MECTMEDLRIEVASRLRNSLHGREIDKTEVDVNLPHMLGITPLGKVHDPKNEEMSILDPKHEFWQKYHDDVKTRNAVAEKIQNAIKSLRADDTFRIYYPRGEEAEIVYIEVDNLTKCVDGPSTECAECGAIIETSFDVARSRDHYNLVAYLDCDNCDFKRGLEAPLQRR